MEEKWGRRRLLRYLGYGYLTSQYCMSDASSSPCKRGAEMPGMEGVEGYGSPFWGVKVFLWFHTATAKGSKVWHDPGMYIRHSIYSAV